MKKYILILIIITPLISFAQKFSDDQIKAAYVFRFMQNIEWQDEAKMDKFQIVVYGNDTTMLPTLRLLAESKKIKGHDIDITWYNELFQLKNKQINLIYITKDKNYEIKELYYELFAQNTLFVSDNNKQKIYIMLNFIYLSDKKISFELNSKTVEEQGLTILPDLMLKGGTELDVRELYKLKEEELKKEQAKVQQGQLLIKQQTAEINIKKKEIEKQKADIVKQKNEIILQNEKINDQVKHLVSVQKDVKKQHRLLAEKVAELENQELLISKQEQNITESKRLLDEQNLKVEERNKILEEQELKIAEHKKLIENQGNTLNQQKGTINTQKGWMIAMGLVILLVLFLIIIIFKNLSAKRKINRELESKNVAILQKTQEVESQAEELRAINEELEKLSIVASETDNAIVIMSQEGDFEWVNDGFTRLYGFSYEEMITKYGKNIKDSSNNRDINDKINTCINNKESVIYENKLNSKDGKVIWVQTTMTPIIDTFGNVTKLVAIDSDINKMKEAEYEINQKNAELTAQRDELSSQKEYIEEQNKHITSSINYGKTIQSAILPSHSEMNNYYESFLLYKPKDIVSGDFFWFAGVKNAKKQTSLVAAVDCTGHGVPGAFMSMIGSRLMNEIVTEKGITSPKRILTELNNSIIKALRQEETDNRDGMDVCLCKVEKEEKSSKITFCGAKRDLIYYKKKEGKIERLKSDRKTIGGMFISKHSIDFTNQELILAKGDTMYLTTDGFIDQNNPERKRYGTPRLLDFMCKIKDEKLEKQKELLENSLLAWQQKEIQRDDITIIGVEI